MQPRGSASDIVRLVRGVSGRVKLRMELIIRSASAPMSPGSRKPRMRAAGDLWA